jgi:hypothetical protein
MDEMTYNGRFVLDQLALLDFYSTSSSSLKQESVGIRFAPLRHIILIQPVFGLYPSCCVLGGGATNTNFIVFSLTRFGFKPTIYCTSVAQSVR